MACKDCIRVKVGIRTRGWVRVRVRVRVRIRAWVRVRVRFRIRVSVEARTKAGALVMSEGYGQCLKPMGGGCVRAMANALFSKTS